MNIVLLLSNELKQSHVIGELSKIYSIRGVVVEDKYTSQNRIKAVLQQAGCNPFIISRIVQNKLRVGKFESRDRKTIERYFLQEAKHPQRELFLGAIKIRNINDQISVDYIRRLSPELIVVFGTSLINREIITIPARGIINVHTGLSPYYRGGQSAFWCLYNDEPEYIGVTIHWLSRGIDNGDIIVQGRPEIEAGDTLCSIECKLAFLATELLKKAIRGIENGTAKRVPQDKKGRLYLSKQYTLDKRLELESRMRAGLIQRYLERKDKVFDKVKIIDG